jgi:hypothetical protein
MNWNWALAGALTTLVMGPWNFGLAGERPAFRAQKARPVVRAQNAAYPQSYQGDPYCEEECEDGHCSPFGRCCGCLHYICTLGGKQGGKAAGRDPRDLNFDYRYRYKAPTDLRYPAANQPAGVVVYPYYTVKGPDDFFLNDPPAPFAP